MNLRVVLNDLSCSDYFLPLFIESSPNLKCINYRQMKKTQLFLRNWERRILFRGDIHKSGNFRKL